MAYASVRGRRPMERASKISHAEVINNPQVQQYLAGCSLPEPADAAVVTDLLTHISEPIRQRIRAVVAIDGGYHEVPVRQDFPASTITFFSFGPLLLDLADLAALDASPFLAPEDMARLKRIQRYSFVLPTQNISLHGRTLQQSIRETLHRFFSAQPYGEPPFNAALRWLLFRGWDSSHQPSWTLPTCPNQGCVQVDIPLTRFTPDETSCPGCGGPIYLIDAFRLHERIDESLGAGGITSYVLTTLEQIALVHVVKAIWDMRPQMLSEMLFIKDGPLAFFGQTSPLCVPMRDMASYLHQQPDLSGANGRTTSWFNAVGLEKSGAFVEHAIQIDDRLLPSTALVLTNDYIYRYIVPGDPRSPDPYGRNTYWGSKLIYKARDGNTYVATIPTGPFTPMPTASDFPNLEEILSVIGRLRCSMYDNALVPVALANKLISLSDFPSARILETFARRAIPPHGL